jgi:hypothetical protein
MAPPDCSRRRLGTSLLSRVHRSQALSLFNEFWFVSISYLLKIRQSVSLAQHLKYAVVLARTKGILTLGTVSSTLVSDVTITTVTFRAVPCGTPYPAMLSHMTSRPAIVLVFAGHG